MNEKADKKLDKKSLKAINQLLEKIPTKDLEKAVGGLSLPTVKVLKGVEVAVLAVLLYKGYGMILKGEETEEKWRKRNNLQGPPSLDWTNEQLT